MSDNVGLNSMMDAMQRSMAVQLRFRMDCENLWGDQKYVDLLNELESDIGVKAFDMMVEKSLQIPVNK